MHNNKNNLIVITPSWLSSLISFVMVFFLLAISFIATRGDDNPIRQGFFATKEITQPSVQQVADRLTENAVTANLPLFLLYAAVGAVIYMIAVYLFGLYSKTAELEAEMHYVNARPDRIIESSLAKLVIQIVTMGVWLLYALFFFKQLIPFVLSTAYEAFAVGGLSTIKGGLFVAAVLFVGLHIHACFFRAVTGRSRLF